MLAAERPCDVDVELKANVDFTLNELFLPVPLLKPGVRSNADEL